MKTIVDTVVDAKSLKTLGMALRGAFLVGTLVSPGPYTMFAPTNDAFAKLPAGTFQAAFEERMRLAEVIAYHVVPGKAMARALASMNAAQTLNGQTLELAASEQGLMVNGVRVLQADVECTNGVIHVIDGVLLPPAMEMAA